MSEKIYAWLLHLYASQFREAYGSEALQLFRDRVRNEKGFFPCLWLWLDLIVDLAISIPREYGYAQAAPFGASVPQRVNSVPVFYLLEGGSPRPGAMFFGSVLSCLALATFWISLSYAGNHVGLGILVTRQLQNESKFFQQEAPQTDRRDASTTKNRAEVFKLDAVERQRVIDAAVVILKKHYIERENAAKMADALLAHGKSGDDDALTDGAAFAALLTRQMRDVSSDRHLTLEYSQDPLPEHPTGQSPEALARYSEAMQQQNCRFERVEILPQNIG